MRAARYVVVVVTPTLEGVAEAQARLAGLDLPPGRLAVLTVGRRPYDPIEVANALQVAILGSLADDRRAALELNAGRLPRRSELWQSATALGAELAARLGAPRSGRRPGVRSRAVDAAPGGSLRRPCRQPTLSAHALIAHESFSAPMPHDFSMATGSGRRPGDCRAAEENGSLRPGCSRASGWRSDPSRSRRSRRGPRPGQLDLAVDKGEGFDRCRAVLPGRLGIRDQDIAQSDLGQAGHLLGIVGAHLDAPNPPSAGTSQP